MAGVVLETLNVRKLIAFGVILFIAQISFFLIGGILSPSPNTSEQILMSRCKDRSGDLNNWLYVRHFDHNGSDTNCKLLEDDYQNDIVLENMGEDEIVFVAQFPHPRDGFRLTMTRWFQQILAVLMLDIKHKYGKQTIQDDAKIIFDLRLGYRNRDTPRDVWYELAHSQEARPLTCTIESDVKAHLQDSQTLNDEFYYKCEFIPLFILASCHHDEYLLNLRIPRDVNAQLSQNGAVLKDVWMVEIHQNGGFTKIWFSLKTFVFPCTMLALCFFVFRVRELNRPMTVLERTIVVLGAGLTFLNCPIEWISLVWNAPFWIILSDLRQGFFFAVLVCFWLIFTGEHMMDGTRSADRVYWPRLILVAGCCASLCIFELAERGVQIRNPFYSIWSHPAAAKLGIASVVIGAVCAFVYFAYLVWLIVRALLQILGKRRLLVSMPIEQCQYYKGVIYRFTALLSYTILCAAMTVAFFVFSRITEDQWSWGERSVEYGSAFITGVYGMWNVYVIAVLCLYAPSHKFRSATGQELYNRLTSSVSCAATDSSYSVRLRNRNSSSSVGNEAVKLCTRSTDRRQSVSRDSNVIVNNEATEIKTEGLHFLRKTNLT